MIKIFVITLHDTNRINSVYQQLEGYDVEYVSATQTSLVDSIRNGSFDYEKYRKLDKNFLPDNAVGCTLSHNAVYKKILENDIEGALILEDDFILNYPNKVLISVIEDIVRSGVELCLLGYSKMNAFDLFNYNLSNPFTICVKLNADFNICKRTFNTTSGTVGYYIRNTAAKKIIDAGIPYYVADEWPLIQTLGVDIYHVSPCLLSESDALISTIESERSSQNQKYDMTSYSILLDFLKIPYRFIKGRIKKWQKNS